MNWASSVSGMRVSEGDEETVWRYDEPINCGSRQIQRSRFGVCGECGEW